MIITSYGPGLRKPSAGGGGTPANFFSRSYTAKQFGLSQFLQNSLMTPPPFPGGIAVEPATGYLWACDFNSGSIYEIRNDGSFVAPWAFPGGYTPMDVCVYGNPATTGAILVLCLNFGTGTTRVYAIVGAPGSRVLTGAILQMAGIGFGIAVRQSNGDIWITKFTSGAPGASVALFHFTGGSPPWTEDASSPFTNVGNNLIDCGDIVVDNNGKAWFLEKTRLCECPAAGGTVVTHAVNGLYAMFLGCRITLEQSTNSLFFTEQVGGASLRIGKMTQPGLVYSEIVVSNIAGYLGGLVINPATGNIYAPNCTANPLAPVVYKITQAGVVTPTTIPNPGWLYSQGSDAQVSVFGGVTYMWWNDKKASNDFYLWSREVISSIYETLITPTAGKAVRVKWVTIMQTGLNNCDILFSTSATLIAKQLVGKSLAEMNDITGGVDEPVGVYSDGASNWWIVIGYDEV